MTVIRCGGDRDPYEQFLAQASPERPASWLADEEETDTRSARALALAGLGRVAEARDELSAIFFNASVLNTPSSTSSS